MRDTECQASLSTLGGAALRDSKNQLEWGTGMGLFAGIPSKWGLGDVLQEGLERGQGTALTWWEERTRKELCQGDQYEEF